MIEFEKLWKENDGDGKEGCEWYWRAALEWVKSRSEVAKSLYMVSVNDIDEELK